MSAALTGPRRAPRWWGAIFCFECGMSGFLAALLLFGIGALAPVVDLALGIAAESAAFALFMRLDGLRFYWTVDQ